MKKNYSVGDVDAYLQVGTRALQKSGDLAGGDGFWDSLAPEIALKPYFIIPSDNDEQIDIKMLK